MVNVIALGLLHGLSGSTAGKDATQSLGQAKSRGLRQPQLFKTRRVSNGCSSKLTNLYRAALWFTGIGLDDKGTLA
jgi:hypothetical protein